MPRGGTVVLALAGLTLVGPGHPRASQAQQGDDSAERDRLCAAPSEARPPDLRCRESLDGRVQAEAPASLTVPKLLLAPPRLVSRAVFWPVVEVSTFIERHRLLEWMEAILTTDDGRMGVRPEVRYASGFRASGGARFFYRPRRVPEGGLVARVHSSGPSVLLGEVDLQGPAWLGLSMRALWDRRGDRLYAGIGPSTQRELEAQGRGIARYGSDISLLETNWSHRHGGLIWSALRADLQRRDYRRASGVGRSVNELYGAGPAACESRGLHGDCVDPGLAPGFQEGLRIVHLGGASALGLGNQTRDGRGLRLALDASYGQGIGRDPSRHLLLGGETLLRIGGTDRALLLRLRASAMEKLGSAAIPFEELVTPSGANYMRGFPDGRFRGESAIVGSAEYRWFIAYNLDATVFLDLGTVAGARFAGLRQGAPFPSIGMGLRRFQYGATYWRAPLEDGFQIAYSREAGLRLLLSTAAF